MHFSKIEGHESSFMSGKKCSEGNAFTFTEREEGGIKIIRLTTSSTSDFYFKEKAPKQCVVLHTTSGYLKGDLATLTKNRVHVCVPYLVARNGTVFELFDPETEWSYHLGQGTVGGNEVMSKATVGVEISNIGPLSLSGNDLLTIYGDVYCSLSDVSYYTKLEAPYRGARYFATMTEAQADSVSRLVPVLCDRFGIPKVLLPEDRRYEVFASNADARAFRGISTHVNYRSSGKSDIGACFDWKRLEGALSPTKVDPPSGGEPVVPGDLPPLVPDPPKEAEAPVPKKIIKPAPKKQSTAAAVLDFFSPIWDLLAKIANGR